jgi:hypothetical protein
MSIRRINDIDTTIENYTLSELMAIAELQELNPPEIVKKTNVYINRFKKSNPKLSAFFIKVQSELLNYAQGSIAANDDEDDEDDDDEGEHHDDDDTTKKIIVENYENMSDSKNPSNNKQQTNWDQNQYLQQSDKNQTDKITNRQQTTKTFGNSQVPMKQEQVATTDTFQVPVKQDSLNPNLKNTTNRFVNLDSQFRKYTNGIETSSTDYTLDLSDTLKNVLSMRLYSYHIPQTWYAIDTFYGNTCFWIVDNANGNTYQIPIVMPSGNYLPAQFVIKLTTVFKNAGFDFSNTVVPSGVTAPVYYDVNSGKITLTLYNGTYSEDGGATILFTITDLTQIVFYDFESKLVCQGNCFNKSNHYLNSTLGWVMGYRMPYVEVLTSGNIAPAALDLNGTKYLILVVDDYNQNRINNNIVSISKFSNTLKLPSYYNNDLTYTCNTPQEVGNNLQELIAGVTIDSYLNFQTTNPLNGLLVGGKYNQEYQDTQIITPSAPRVLTQSQIYTINEISKNRNNNTKYLATAPSSGDVLAILPIKISPTIPTGSMIVEFSGILQDNKRIYFGPVDIDRLAVKLLDDKGNVLNLNGCDYSIMLICECLYQY